MRIKASDKISSLTKKQFNKLFDESINFCLDAFGFNKRKKTCVTVAWAGDQYETCMYGWYDHQSNTICLTSNCKTVSEFTKTMIHEWTHYMQPVTTHYERLYREHGYDNHPMEVEARDMEQKWNRKLLNHLKRS